jgi:hypothetical protein
LETGVAYAMGGVAGIAVANVVVVVVPPTVLAGVVVVPDSLILIVKGLNPDPDRRFQQQQHNARKTTTMTVTISGARWVLNAQSRLEFSGLTLEQTCKWANKSSVSVSHLHSP